MKHCTKRWIDPTLRVAAVIGVAFLALSCVSQPDKPDSVSASPSVVADPSPEAIDSFQKWPNAAGVTAELAESVLPPRPADPPGKPAAPVEAAAPAGSTADITVLSSAPAPNPATAIGSMDEPAAPSPAAKPAPAAAAPAAKPATAPAPKPVATKPAQPASAVTQPAASSKPAPPATAPPAYSLPSAPASSMRSEDPAALPVADISVEAVRGQPFELRFTGAGWTYLGDEQSRDGIRYETRRFQDNEVVFTLGTDRAGEYLLRFQRQDPVDGSRKASLVRVTVRDPGSAASSGGQAGSSTAAASPSISTALATAPAGATASPAPSSPSGAPLTPGAVAAAQNPTGTAAASTPGSSGSAVESAGTQAGSSLTGSAAAPSVAAAVAPSSPSTGVAGDAAQSAAIPTSPAVELTDPAAILSFARDELSAKRVRAALDALDRYVNLFKSGNDEVYYLYGLAYEQDTPFRDIKQSYAFYKRVRDEYPRSTRWKAAAERVAYMERHYYGLK